MSNPCHHTWTKESWLAYKAWAEEWIAYQLSWWTRVRAAVEQMEDRED